MHENGNGKMKARRRTNGDMKARWRWEAVGVYLSTAALSSLLFAFAPAVSGTVFSSVFSLLGLLLASAAVLGGLLLTDFPFAEVPSPPSQALSDLGARLRFANARVEEGKGSLKAHLSHFASVEIRAKEVNGLSRITFRAEMSSAAMTIAIVSLLLVPILPIAILLGLYGFLMARSFALKSIAPLLGPSPGPPSGTPPKTPDDFSTLLVNSLAEGHRMAAEAYEAEHESYTDTLAIVFLGALFLWSVALGFLAFTSADPDWPARIARAFQVSTAIAIPFGLGTGLLVRRRFLERLRRYRDRMEALRSTWAREVARVPSEDGGQSAFELLAESSREVPDWLDAIRRRGLWRDPSAGFLIAMMGLWGGLLVAGATAAMIGLTIVAAAFATVVVALTGALFVLYRRAKLRWETGLAEDLRRWSARFDELRSRMDRFLQDL